MAAAADAARPAAPASDSGRDHIVVFPFMAKGHTLPFLHFASALAAHHGDLRVTVVTTPGNLAFARRRLPARVGLVALPFPSHPELPAGIESTDALPAHALFPAFLRSTALLREPFAGYLASLPAPPLALVSDFFLGFTQRVAGDAGVPRVTFHGMSAFSLALCFSLATRPPPAESLKDGTPFRVPGFPESITITADEVPHAVAQAADLDDPVTRFLFEEVRDWDYKSWGVLVNSFDALDGDYAAILESFYLPGARAWLVGPLFLAAGESLDGASGDDDEEDPEGCLAWLDERRPGSVVYVSFGTQVHVTVAQLEELAHGLVDSGHAFLWAVRSSDDAWSPPVDVGPEGKVVRGWVPQRRVLAHQAVGGFVSHCGWNSVLESHCSWRATAAGTRGAAAGVARDGRAGREREACRGHPRRRRPRGREGWCQRGGAGARRQGAGGGESLGADGRRRGRAEDARPGRARPGRGVGSRERRRHLAAGAPAVVGRAVASLRPPAR